MIQHVYRYSEIAINQYNAKDSSKFIFLLSIRAAGRGLNLQTADTVVVYDPDPNPKNEEQAVARSHRIGQKREVRCLHLEAVMDEVGAGDDEGGIGSSTRRGADGSGNCGIDDTTWGTGGQRKFTESIESMVRNVIQQQKIEMADEIINAGRFDQQTTHAERRETLEKLMQEAESGAARSCQAFSMRKLNEKLARTPEEVELFNKMDTEADLWPGTLTSADETPPWIRYLAADREEATASTAKVKPGRAGAEEESRKAAAVQAASGVSLGRGERSRGGFVPGAYAAADAALTGDDAEAVKLRRAKAEAKAAAGSMGDPEAAAAAAAHAAATATASATAAAKSAAADAVYEAARAVTEAPAVPLSAPAPGLPAVRSERAFIGFASAAGGERPTAATAAAAAAAEELDPNDNEPMMGADEPSESEVTEDDLDIHEVDEGVVDMDDEEDEDELDTEDEDFDGMVIGEPLEDEEEEKEEVDGSNLAKVKTVASLTEIAASNPPAIPPAAAAAAAAPAPDAGSKPKLTLKFATGKPKPAEGGDGEDERKRKRDE
jgi:hypothetical protein